MSGLELDDRERSALCELLDQLGPAAPTLLEGWTTHDLAAHLVLRERDLLAAPGLVLPGACARFAEGRRQELKQRDFGTLVELVRTGPPPGFFRFGWVRSLANVNELFVHHEDVRRANGLGPRDELPPAFEAALWRNVRRAGWFLSRRLRGVELTIEWAGGGDAFTVRGGAATASLRGTPGELLLFLFGRTTAAAVDVSGPADAVLAVRGNHFGM